MYKAYRRRWRNSPRFYSFGVILRKTKDELTEQYPVYPALIALALDAGESDP